MDLSLGLPDKSAAIGWAQVVGLIGILCQTSNTPLPSVSAEASTISTIRAPAAIASAVLSLIASV